jgi:hypothetical protein
MNATRASRVLLTAAALLVAGCGHSSDASNGAPTTGLRLPNRPLSPAPSRTTTTDRFATGLPTHRSKAQAVPPAPGTVGALALASIPAVVGVHNLAASAGRPSGLPPRALRDQAEDVRRELAGVRVQLAPSPHGARSRLASILDGYLGIAASLGRRQRPLGAASRSHLASLDLRWRHQLHEISRQAGSHLLAKVPALPRPNIPAPPLRDRTAR